MSSAALYTYNQGVGYSSAEFSGVQGGTIRQTALCNAYSHLFDFLPVCCELAAPRWCVATRAGIAVSSQQFWEAAGGDAGRRAAVLFV